MNQLELKYYSYELKLKQPFQSSKGKINTRKGLIISLQSSSGAIGLGDAAPFPEFGSESYDEAYESLNNFELGLKLDLENVEESLNKTLVGLNKTPALRHGIEQAILNLISNDKNISFNELLNVHSHKEIGVNAVVGFMSPEDSAATAFNLVNEGFKTLKLKTGRANFEEDLACIKSIKEKVGNEIKLRADANGKWKLEEAVEYLTELQQFDLEYIEQPVNTLSDFIALYQKTFVPLAVDESIRTVTDAKAFINSRVISAVVVKPMICGGIIPTLEIIKHAEERGIKVTISSSFETNIGRSLAIFAASTVKQKNDHGLYVSHYFEKDITPEAYHVKNGKISLEC